MADTTNNNQIMNEKIANACRIFEASLTAIKEIFDKTQKYGTPTVRDFTFRAENIADIRKAGNEIENAFDKMYDSIAVLGYYSPCKDDKDMFIKFCKSSLDNMLNKKSYELSGLIVYETTIAAAIACYCVTEAAITAECDIVKDKYQYRGDYDDGNITWSLSSDSKKVYIKSTDSEIKKDYYVHLQADSDSTELLFTETKQSPYGSYATSNNNAWVLDYDYDDVVVLKEYEGNDTDVIIPDSVIVIGEGAFAQQTNLTSITIPYSVDTIESEAFQGCSGLINVTIPDSVISIGDCAFEGCESLTSITIPDSVTTIGDCAFYGCKNLRDANGFVVFRGVLYGYFGSENNITIPTGVTSIEGYAFAWSENLISITIPDSVTSIGYYAFQDCESLTNITITDSVTSIGEDAFDGCENLTIHAPAGSYAEQYAKANNIPFEAM